MPEWSRAPNLFYTPPLGVALTLVAHVDWSIRPDKRQCCVATRTGGQWVVEMPRPVHDLVQPAALAQHLSERAASGFAFLGMDAALGLPSAWGQRAGVTHLRPFLAQTLREPQWQDFWTAAERPEQITLRRPFYPRRPGGARQHHLVTGLGLTGAHELRRQCDRRREGSPTPCPMFWTMGANQVGKATLSAWREVVVPALCDPNFDLRIWPFDGGLYECTRGDLALAEVYPGEVARWLGLQMRGSGGKRSQQARSEQAHLLWKALDQVDAHPDAALARAIDDGFGSAATGEDAFDAFTGVLGGLLCCGAHRSVWQPGHPPLTSLEGWVLGRAPPDGEAER